MHRTWMRQTRTGFTLVEVLTVVAILAIAGAIVVPQMLATGHMHVQAAGRVIIQDLLVAQNEAIAQQSPRRVVFDATLNRYTLTDQNGLTLKNNWRSGGTGTNDYIVDFAADSRFSGVSLKSPKFGEESYIEFDDLGTPTAGGTVDVVTKDFTYRIRVADMTGRVTIDKIQE